MIQELQTGILDINNKYNIDFSCKQLDDIILKIIVYDKSLPADLSNYNCRLKAFKAEQVPVIQNTNISIKDNVVTIKASKQLTTTVGIVKAELQFINKTTLEKKSTFYLEIKVAASVLDVDGVVSTPTCTILEEIDNKLDQIEDIKLDIIEAVKVKNDLNTSRTDANNMNNTLKTTTTNADNKKKEVETAINNASNKIKEVQDSTNTANTAKQAVDSSVLQANASKQALDTSKVNADNTKKEVDAAIIVADEKIEIIKNLDPENVVEDVKNLKKQVLESTYTKIETDSTLTKLESCKDSFVHNMHILGKTLQNLWDNSKTLTTINSSLVQQQYSDFTNKFNTKGIYTIVNTSNKTVGLDFSVENTTNYTRDIKLLANSKTVLTLNSDFPRYLKGNFTDGWENTDSSKNEFSKSLMILEGEVKEIPPFFEGIKSTGEAEGNKISILSCGKNLVDITKIKGSQTTEVVEKSHNSVTLKQIVNDRLYIQVPIYMKFKKNTKYTLSANVENLNTCLRVYNLKNDDSYCVLNKTGSVTFTTRDDTNLQLLFYTSWTEKENSGKIAVFKDIQLEEGSTATSYEEYKEDKTTILLGSPHMGLPDGVADVVDHDKSERIRNVGKVILNGSERWILHPSPSNQNNTICFLIDDCNYLNPYTNNDLINFLSDRFISSTRHGEYDKVDNEFVSMSNNASDTNLKHYVCIRINKSKLSTPDVPAFKKWLQANPVTVYYQLANPIIEKLNIKDTLQSFQNGYIQLNNAITPSASLEYSTNIPSAIGGLTKVVDHNVDEITNIESTISDMDAEVDEARKGKATLNERLEDDKSNILNTIGDLNTLSTEVKTSIVNALNESLGITKQLSNPNLLINGDFQIWQRGESFENINLGLYTCDRWKINTNQHITIEKIGNGIKVINLEKGFNGIEQYIENPNKYANKKVTISFYAKSNSKNVCLLQQGNNTTISSSNEISSEYSLQSFTTTLPNTFIDDKLKVRFMFTNEIGTLDIEWVKLELGSVATPFIPRSYGEELALCQRYYQSNYITGWFSGSVTTSGNYVVVKIPLPTTLRLKPTLINDVRGTMQYYNGGWINLNNVVVSAFTNNVLTLNSDLPSGASNGGIYLIKFIPSFDAEIY